MKKLLVLGIVSLVIAFFAIFVTRDDYKILH